MKRTYIGSFALAFALSGMSLAAAQDRTSNGNTTGTSVPRGGDGGSSSSSGGSSSGGSSGSSSSSSGSSGSMGSSSVPAAAALPSYEAPRRANDGGGQRSRPAGSTSGDRAVTRGSGGSSGGGGITAASAGFDASGEPRRAVPTYSRPRDGRPITGTAVERGSVPPPPGGGGNIIYYPYYPWGFWGPGYSFGLGYMFYDPWYYGAYGYGWGAPYGYGTYGYGGGGGGYSVSQSYHESGSLRLKIDPKNAEVYVDGYYVGVVDSFDGAFQKISLDSGNHKIELKAAGFEPTAFDVLIPPGETVTYKGNLKRIK